MNEVTRLNGAGDVELRELIRAEINDRHGRLVREHGPLVIGLIAFALLIALLPSKAQDQRLADAGGGRVSGFNDNGGPAADGPGVSSGGDAVTGTAGAAASQSGGIATGATHATNAAAAGVAKSGVRCGPGVRQVPWSKYAAACVPAWSGNNGGATAHGVTAKEITVVYRRQTGDPSAAVGFAPQDDTIATLQAYITFFNKTFETYGRTVVLKTFEGRGSDLAEAQGQGQPAAESDAQAAYDAGAFANAVPYGSGMYSRALAARKVITLMNTIQNRAAYRDTAPYVYANPETPVVEDSGQAIAATVCQRMYNLPAIFAGDPVYQHTTRVFGALENEDADMVGGIAEFSRVAGSMCGLKLKTTATYPSNSATGPSAFPSLMAQFKAAGVTTVIDFGPLAALFGTQAAARQDYHPEWIQSLPATPVLNHSGDQGELAHAIGISNMPRNGHGPNSNHESVKVYMAATGKPPTSGIANASFMDWTYWWAVEFFGAVQGAGPNLNPTTFRQGFRALPKSSGDYGLWNFDLSSPDPAGDYAVWWWDPAATDEVDGKAGTMRACEGARRWPLPYASDMGSGQLHCFGK